MSKYNNMKSIPIDSLNEEKSNINTEISDIYNKIANEKLSISEKWEPIL